MNEQALSILEDERDGCHGVSERRAVAAFILDAMDGNDGDEIGQRALALTLCDSLDDAIRDIAARLKGITSEDSPEDHDFDPQCECLTCRANRY